MQDPPLLILSMLRTLSFFALTLASSLVSAEPQKQEIDPLAIHSPLLKVEVLDQAGSPIAMSHDRGYRRVDCKANDPYTLRLSNPTDERIWVVIAINDINPLTGKRAYQGQPGIVISPGGSRLVSAMSTKQDRHALRFSDTQEKKGKVAFAVFKEKMDYPHLLPWSEQLANKVGGHVSFNSSTKRTTWIPPQSAPFRKKSADPEGRVYFEYSSTE